MKSKTLTPSKQASKQVGVAALRSNFRNVVDSVCLWQVFRVIRENHSATELFRVVRIKLRYLVEKKKFHNSIKSGHRVKFIAHLDTKNPKNRWVFHSVTNAINFVWIRHANLEAAAHHKSRCRTYFHSFNTKTISALSSFYEKKITLSYPQAFCVSGLFHLTHTINKPHKYLRTINFKEELNL